MILPLTEDGVAFATLAVVLATCGTLYLRKAVSILGASTSFISFFIF
jgi:hypothetical protein